MLSFKSVSYLSSVLPSSGVRGTRFLELWVTQKQLLTLNVFMSQMSQNYYLLGTLGLFLLATLA
jgi:hypothetical protein